MWEGKKKAVTFSFDDGVMQDKQIISILDKYNLKSTFNLNSALFGFRATLDRGSCTCPYNHIPANEIREVYKKHEIAVHTLVHPLLTTLTEEAIIWQIEGDKKLLEGFCDYPIKCMAYPGGVTDDRLIDIIKNKTDIEFSRAVASTHNFDMQENLLNFLPTVHWEEDCVFDLIDKFLKTDSDKPQLFYIWGHAYELDFEGKITLDKFEKICKMLANKNDIYYGTNSEVLLKKTI